MAQLINVSDQRNARPDVAHAVAYAAPLWVMGSLAFISIFDLLELWSHLSFGFSALAIAAVTSLTVAAFNMMVRDLQRDSALCGRSYRRMMSCPGVIGHLHQRVTRSASFKAQSYVLAGMRQRAHMRSPVAVAMIDDPLRKRRDAPRRR